jgi:GTP-binding protein
VKFIDEAKIHVRAGDGGNGCASFRREAHTPRGGPSGGDGGDGGNVLLVVDPQLNTLLDFQNRRHYRAERGEDGRNKDQYGKGGEDLLLRVPVGTVVFDDDSGEVLADLTEPDSSAVIASGGIGGRGNIHFKSPIMQAPTEAEPGTPGDIIDLRMELKLLADVGLLGYPNAGKSTFISKVSKARPRIADYPFTTLIPNLGVVRLGPDRTMVVADIPGIIEGAAEGAGLGHQFLRHVERSRVLLHVIESSELTGPERDPVKDFDTLNAELARYAPDLADKPQIVVFNKIDLTDSRELFPILEDEFAQRGITLHSMSAVTGEGVEKVLNQLWRLISV